MVSTFWSACSEGNLPLVRDLFNDPSQVDLDLKDEAGNTPLIQAVTNGHVEVVKLLLENGANFANGLPAQHTSNPAILELFKIPQDGPTQQLNGGPPTENGFVDQNGDQKPVFYPPPPPPGAYPYFHPGHSGQPGPEGPGFYAPYPPPPTNGEPHPSGGPGNLPPADIARFIPCRYYPACRYGATCMFAHPPQGPYMPGPMPGPMPPPPPGSYPFDPSYAPTFYPPPHSFQPNGVPPMNHSPNSAPLHPDAQSYVPISPVTPTSYPIPPGVPMSLPPPHMNGIPSPTAAYPHPPPFVPRPEMSFPPPVMNGNGAPYPMPEVHKMIVNGGEDNYRNGPSFRENAHPKRGTGRRGSFTRPACLFYPMGKCKNGSECRFPHVLEQGPLRATAPRPPRPHMNGASNGMDGLQAKMGNMHMQGNGRPMNGAPFGGARGGKMNNGVVRNDRKVFATRQKLPSPDDFPTLAGSTTPPLRSPGLNGHASIQNGLTAAQVLASAAPPRKEASSTRGPSPETVPTPADSSDSPEVVPQAQEDVTVPDVPALQETISAPAAPTPAIPKKLPVSFAAVAAAPELSKDQAISV